MIESGTIESVAGILLKGGPAAFALLALLLAILIRYRTNSTHTILRWLWRLISGKAKGDNPAFNAFMDAQDNLMQFRFISGKARTVAQMHSLINWGTRHDEDILDMNACGPYFDRELPGLKAAHQRPARTTLILLTLGLGAIASLFVISTMFATVQGALVTVKATNKWLIIGNQSTRSVLNPGAERLSRDQCQLPMEKRIADSGFGTRDITVICGVYSDPDSSKFITKTVGEQLWLFGSLSVMLLGFFGILYRIYTQGNAALRMAQRLGRPRP